MPRLMDTDVPENAVVVYRTYIANAPSEQSGCTLMWHGLKRDWEDEDLLLKIQDCFPLDEIDYVYLPLNFWLRDGKESLSKSKVKNKGYAFVHLSDAKKEAEFSGKVWAKLRITSKSFFEYMLRVFPRVLGLVFVGIEDDFFLSSPQFGIAECIRILDVAAQR